VAKLVLVEAESAELERFLNGETQLVSCVILRVELLRAMRRAGLVASAEAKAERVLERFNLRQLSEEILLRAAEVVPKSLRTIDALHLATALDLSPPPDLFLCYNHRLAAGARQHGLAVVAPGAEKVHQL
jgi:uncharacterized protein